MKLRTALLRSLAATAAGTALILATPVPASAHVTITPSGTEAGSHTVLTVSLSHGCAGSATTSVAVKIPEPILSVTPTRHPFWEAETTIVELGRPVADSHGNSVTERVDTVVFTSEAPLPDGQRDTFEIALKLPEKPGELVFPAVQTCEQGEVAWVEIPGGEEELEHPAPVVLVTAPDADASPAQASSQGIATAGLLGLGAGALGILLGGAALVQARRRP